LREQGYKWKSKREEKLKEYLIISYIISIFLMGLLVLKMFINRDFGLMKYHFLLITPFFITLFVVSNLIYNKKILENPSLKTYIVFITFVFTITLLIYYNIEFNKITDINRHFFKIYYFIPIILYTVNYGQPFGFFAATWTILNIFLLNYILGDFTNLDLDFIIILMFFWVAWLIGGYTGLEKKVQNYLELLTNNLRKTNQSLRESQELFRLNFDEAHIGMTICDIEGYCIKANKALLEMLGYQVEELSGQRPADLLHEEDQSKAKDVMEKLLKGEIDTANYEIRYINKEGSIIWTNHNTTLVRNTSGKPVYFLNHIEDITRKKLIEAEVKKQKEMLEYNMLRTQFFAKLSHELKTPLNLIFTALQIINSSQNKYFKDEGQEKINKYLSLIKQNSYRLLRLVNNVIDLTKIDTNSFTLNLEEHNIVTLVKEITMSTEDYIINHKRFLEFYTDVDEKIITCDPFSVERIILNLISNAVKFTSEGDKIIVSISDRDDKVLIKVKDTGIGIKEDKLALIFEQFRQVDESFTRRSEGSGIGLSIVKSLVELHGGNIWVESEFGKGSEFFIELPVKRVTDEKTGQDYVPDNLIDKINIEFSDIYDL
jgi:PAS domain S-box-containing protein